MGKGGWRRWIYPLFPDLSEQIPRVRVWITSKTLMGFSQLMGPVLHLKHVPARLRSSPSKGRVRNMVVLYMKLTSFSDRTQWCHSIFLNPLRSCSQRNSGLSRQSGHQWLVFDPESCIMCHRRANSLVPTSQYPSILTALIYRLTEQHDTQPYAPSICGVSRSQQIPNRALV